MGDITLPNGVVLSGIPEGTPWQEVQEYAIATNQASASDFVEQREQPIQATSPSPDAGVGLTRSRFGGEYDSPLTQLNSRSMNPEALRNIADLTSRHMEVPGGIAGSIAGAAAGAPLGPVGVIVMGVVGGALGSGGGSLLSDKLEGQELDYWRATEEAMISAGVDTITLGLGSVIKPAWIAARASARASPNETALQIVQEAIDGANDAGTKESLLASQRILLESGSGTLNPAQTGNTTGVKTFLQRIGEIGLFSRGAGEANTVAVNNATRDALFDLIERSGVVSPGDFSTLGHNLEEIIIAGKGALSETYGEGLTELQRELAGTRVSTRGIQNTLDNFFDEGTVQGYRIIDVPASSTTNPFTGARTNVPASTTEETQNLVMFTQETINALRDFRSMVSSVHQIDAAGLIAVEKKLLEQAKTYSIKGGPLFNDTAARELARLTSSLKGSVTSALNTASPGAGDAYRLLNEAYADGIQGMLPRINERFVANAGEGHWEMLGRLAAENGDSDQVKALMRSIDSAYGAVGVRGGSTAITNETVKTAEDAKHLIRQAFVLNTFKGLSRDFSGQSYKNLASELDNPSIRAKVGALMGKDFGRYRQILNLMEESSSNPTSNIGELVIRGAEWGAVGTAATLVTTGAGGLGGSAASLGAAAAVLLGPIGIAKLSTSQELMTRLIALQKGNFPTQQALTAFTANLASDVFRTFNEEEKARHQEEWQAMENASDVPSVDTIPQQR